MKAGAGFIAVVLTTIACVSFFAWGLQKPKLERVWELQVGLSSGRKKTLSSEERKVLVAAIRKHPGLVDSMIGEDHDIGMISANRDGLIEDRAAYLIRRSGSPRRKLEVIATDVRGKEAVEVSVRAGEEKIEGQVGAGASFSWELPAGGKFPELIEVRVRAPGKRDRHAIVVRTEVIP